MRYAGFLIAYLGAVVVTITSCGGAGTTTSAGGGQGTGSTGTSTQTGGTQSGGANAGQSSSGGDIDIDAGQSDGGGCSGATTCAEQGATCGPIGDGCGEILDCGTCAAPETCGGGGTPSKCGKPPCAAKTCVELNATCGMNGDGCGAVLDCGTCTEAGDTCGGGGIPNACGHTTMCTPKTCADLGFNCGMNGDGCGGVLNCGTTCPSGQSCGGGGMASVCGAPPCTPKTCAQLGATCGPVADGCGALLMCGTCNAPQVCGGSGTSNQCGTAVTCTNLCLQQTTCANPAVTTTVTGTVYAPNGTDPLPSALVYVPNAAVLAFTAGVSCDQCGASASGSPLVTAVTGVDGKFTLKNMPVGANIPLVIQLGRWRRQVVIPSVPSCVTTPIAATLTRLPKQKSEGDIPLIAFATGDLDGLECVMRKVGIVDAEFTKPTGTGRIHLYTGLDDSGSFALGGATAPGGGTAVYESALWGTQTALNKYDMVLFPCQGDAAARTAAQKQIMINYANAGGRIFATHYSYNWLYNAAPFSGTANWTPDAAQLSADPQTGFIDQTFPKGQLLAQWLQVVGASTTLGQIQIQNLRNDLGGLVAPSQRWMSVNDATYGSKIMHYTFNTPVGAAPAMQCGRVLYDDFHVEQGANHGTTFPTECVAGAMTPQEKLLEFMIFDLGSCITPDIPTCTPKTCAQQGLSCGPAGDGCGAVIQCGVCPTGQTCGGGGVPSTCGSPNCTPQTCVAQNIQCGPAGDGCGGLIQCGNCPAGQTCGGGGMPGVCGNQTCTPKTCAQLGIQCGPAGDGCGALIQCGACANGQTCGGGGMSGVCGGGCTAKTCAELGANCGPVGNGCGAIIQCGTCAVPQTCGGGGKASVCGGGGPA
jgi:hypothetical protein